MAITLDCKDCGEMVAYCWADSHIPVELWNYACESDRSIVPVDEKRCRDKCALCGERMKHG